MRFDASKKPHPARTISLTVHAGLYICSYSALATRSGYGSFTFPPLQHSAGTNHAGKEDCAVRACRAASVGVRKNDPKACAEDLACHS